MTSSSSSTAKQQQHKDVDAASVLTTSSFSSTVSLIRKGVKSKIHGSSKLSKEEKKEREMEKKLEPKEKRSVPWIPDLSREKTRES
jgi:hypothetical protein